VGSSGDDDTTDSDVGPPIAPHRDRPRITVLTGSLAGQLFDVHGPSSLIGRLEEAEIRLNEEGVSRHHAEIRRTADGFAIVDLGSTNGTFVNGLAVAAETPLSEGDKISVGGIVLRFAHHDELDDSFHAAMIASALRDPLTQLYNKRYLLDRIESEVAFARRHASPLSLLMIDVDHFKLVNDRHGHLAGDAVLVNIARILTDAIRDEDVVARFGGEELAIVLRATELDAATSLAERVRRRVEESTVDHGGESLGVTISIGVAAYPVTDAQTGRDLLAAADRALYRAKEDGRNRVCRS
jgi:diguanylate cyclase (GGDEF)-like protein